MSTSRQQMIETAARLFQRDGYHATTWRGLVEEAGAPWGSINHHFPGGKQQLATEAIELGAQAVEGLIEHCFAQHATPADAVAAWFELSAELMVSTEFATGCPIATVALEVLTTPGPLRDATEHAFAGWERLVARHLRDAGDPDPDDTALIVLALLEGALILARTRRDPRPMTLAGQHARKLLSPTPRGLRTSPHNR